jgi:hypothetical protein
VGIEVESLRKEGNLFFVLAISCRFSVLPTVFDDLLRSLIETDAVRRDLAIVGELCRLSCFGKLSAKRTLRSFSVFTRRLEDMMGRNGLL